MKKSILIYAGVFFVLALVLFILMYVFMIKKDDDKVKVEAADTLTTAIADSSVVADSTETDSTLAKPDTLITPDENVPDPLVEYNNLMLLRNRLIEFYSGNRITQFTAVEIDSIMKRFVNEVDSLSRKQQRYIRKINDLSGQMKLRDQQITMLKEQITMLQSDIANIRSIQTQKGVGEYEAAQAKRLKQLADTFNSMQPKEVASAMLSLTDDQIVRILKMMTERKSGKVLAALPPARKATVVQKMLE